MGTSAVVLFYFIPKIKSNFSLNTVETIDDQIGDPITALSQMPNSHNVDLEINQMIQSYAADIGATLVEKQNSDVIDRQWSYLQVE